MKGRPSQKLWIHCCDSPYTSKSPRMDLINIAACRVFQNWRDSQYCQCNENFKELYIRSVSENKPELESVPEIYNECQNEAADEFPGSSKEAFLQNFSNFKACQPKREEQKSHPILWSTWTLILNLIDLSTLSTLHCSFHSLPLGTNVDSNQHTVIQSDQCLCAFCSWSPSDSIGKNALGGEELPGVKIGR